MNKSFDTTSASVKMAVQAMRREHEICSNAEDSPREFVKFFNQGYETALINVIGFFNELERNHD